MVLNSYAGTDGPSPTAIVNLLSKSSLSSFPSAFSSTKLPISLSLKKIFGTVTLPVLSLNSFSRSAKMSTFLSMNLNALSLKNLHIAQHSLQFEREKKLILILSRANDASFLFFTVTKTFSLERLNSVTREEVDSHSC